MKYSFTILGEPVAVGRVHVNTYTGQAYNPEKTQDALDSISKEIWAKLVNDGFSKCVFPATTAVRATLTFYRTPVKDPKYKHPTLPIQRPDTDNYIKILDSLNRRVYFDDSQITTIIARKRHGNPPRIEFTFEEDFGE